MHHAEVARSGLLCSKQQPVTANGMKSFITGLAGPQLSDLEARFLADHQPAGIILFKRNLKTPDQVRRLIEAALTALGDDQRLVLVDQEGGRVQRLVPPHWPRYPSGKMIGDLYARHAEKGKRAAYLAARLIAGDLKPLGFNLACLPVLDCRQEGMTDAIGDRAYARDPKVVAQLGKAACLGLRSGGLLPAIKHMPGHGRAKVDSHIALPVVEASREQLTGTDFEPFRQLGDQPIGMTAHLCYTALDATNAATLSPTVVGEIIRGDIGFDGLLLTDDMSMKALGASMGERCQAALEAGCDLLLHCNGDRAEMADVAAAAQDIGGACARRFAAALTQLVPPDDLDLTAARAEFVDLLAPLGWQDS